LQVHGDRSADAEIGLLTLWLLRIPWSRRDLGREVPDPLDVIFRENPMTQRFKVKPLVRCALDGSVVEIESVDVHVGCHVGVSLPVPSLVAWLVLAFLETEP